MAVVGDEFRLLPRGSIGELVVAGKGLTRGYHNQPTLTSERFVDVRHTNLPEKTVYRTGDLARWLPDGTIEYNGRLDNQVKIRGYRIEPGEIEAVLEKHPKVEQAAVIEHPEADSSLVAYVKPVDQYTDSIISELKIYLESKLPPYMIPAIFIILQEMPLTSNCKINRNELPEADLTRNQAVTTYIAPRNDLESSIALTWAEVLNVKKIGVHDNFFDLGGHSLSGLSLIRKINSKFSKSFSIGALFNSPTIALLGKVISTNAPDKKHSMLLRKNGVGTPIFCMPGLSRNPLVFQKLTTKINPNRPIYGIELPVPVNGKETLRTLKEVGEHIVKEIKSIQPNDPYTIMGYSLGGLLAYETARQLYALEKEVNKVFIFDSYVARPPNGVPFPKTRTQWIIQMLRTKKWDYFSFFIRNLIMVNLFWRFGLLNSLNGNWENDDGTHIEGVPNFDISELTYEEQPPAFPFKLHLFASRQNAYTRMGNELISKWADLTTLDYETAMVKTDFHLKLLEDKYLDYVANQINDALKEDS